MSEISENTTDPTMWKYPELVSPNRTIHITNLEAKLTRYRRIFSALLKGIHTDRVDAQVSWAGGKRLDLEESLILLEKEAEKDMGHE